MPDRLAADHLAHDSQRGILVLDQGLRQLVRGGVEEDVQAVGGRREEAQLPRLVPDAAHLEGRGQGVQREEIRAARVRQHAAAGAVDPDAGAGQGAMSLCVPDHALDQEAGRGVGRTQ